MRHPKVCAYILLTWLLSTTYAEAVLREWDNEGATQNWSDAANWSGDIVPLLEDDASIGGLPAAFDEVVLFDLNGDNVTSLALTNGADFDTNGGRLVINANTSVGTGTASGATVSELIVRPRVGIDPPAPIDTTTMSIGANGRLSMLGGEVEVDGTGFPDGILSIAAGGELSGFGNIDTSDLDTQLAETTSLITNDGAIIAGDPVPIIGEPTATTLQLSASRAPLFGQFDFGGSSGLGTVSVLRNASLVVNPTFLGPERLTVFGNSTFEMNGDGSLIAGSTLEVNSGVVNPETPNELPAAPATIAGSGVLTTMGTIRLNEADEELIVEARVDGAAGVLSNRGVVRFRGGGGIRGLAINAVETGTIHNESSAALNFQGGNSYATPLTNDGLMGILRQELAGTVELQDFSQTPNGELEIDIAGLAAGDFDALTLEDAAALDGTLTVNLEDLFEPTVGESFTILTTQTGNVSGQFAITNLPEFSGRTFEVVYNAQSVELEVVATTLEGDFDQDGDIDGTDFLLWQQGGSPDPLSATDLADWQTNYGQGPSELAGIASVPEPTAFAFAAIAVGLAASTIRQRSLSA